MAETVPPLRIGLSNGITLQLEFHWRGDRYRQSLVSIDAQGERTQILESVEGDDTEPWPPSPPVQQLTVESQAAGQVALGVGQSGRSHWSISIQALDQQGFLCELACRHAGELPSLCSTYESLESQSALDHVASLRPLKGTQIATVDASARWQLSPCSSDALQRKTRTWSYWMTAQRRDSAMR